MYGEPEEEAPAGAYINYRSCLLDIVSNYMEHHNYVDHNITAIIIGIIGIYTFQRSSYNMESQRKKLLSIII